MKRLLTILSTVLLCSFIGIKLKQHIFTYPEYWPKPVYDFETNPITEDGFQLGRTLFYDVRLSRDNTISCASCHLQATGFTHVDHDLSHGIEGKIGTRNSLAIMNLAWSDSFMWDGGVNHIEVQALAPLTSAVEMDESLANVVTKLDAIPLYKELFYKAYNDSTITGQRILLGLTQFTLMLNTHNSKYDKYIRNEIEFTEQEENGFNLFKTNCASCHTEPLFSSNKFRNNGLAVDTTLNDYGRMEITQNPNDSLKFKVPTLRNIQFTKPYMHDGRFETLQEVITHYTSGIHKSETLADELVIPIILNHREKVDLLVFLQTLTDKEFLFNKRFSFPKKLITQKETL
jgi:cytochrome c peroxidase